MNNSATATFQLSDLLQDFLEIQKKEAKTLTVEQLLANFESLFSSMSAYKKEGEETSAANSSESQMMFNEIGKLTRKIHTAIEQFDNALSPTISSLLNGEIPDTASKIEYVLDLTEKSTHTVLGELEKQEVLISEQERKVQSAIDSIKAGAAEPIKALEELNAQKEFLANLYQSNTTILSSQGFQDINGQVLKKVISLIASVEENLVSLLRVFGKGLPPNHKPIVVESDLNGPSVEGCSQDDIDDLLSSLGF